MSTQTKLRRGTISQVNSMTPAEAEVVVDLTNDRLHLGDGVTTGGIILPKAYDITHQSFGFAVAGGSENALTITVPIVTVYSQPLRLSFRAIATNTGPATINVNGLGERNIYKISGTSITALAAGDIIVGGMYDICYDGVQFQLVNMGDSGLVSVSQGDLNTSTGSINITLAGTAYFAIGAYESVVSIYTSRISLNATSTTGSIVNSTLPGGLYGFYPQTRRSTTNQYQAQQTYITSSPPYDIGDGEVGGFIFLKLDKDNTISQTYMADAPPWAYNGPTDIRATHKCRVTGKKFRKVLKKRSVKEIMDGAPIEYKIEEITQDVKNKDMKVIPHPFDVSKGEKVLILDPMSDQVRRLIDLQNAGAVNEVNDIVNNYINLDNSSITRACPKGVTPCKFKFKGK